MAQDFSSFIERYQQIYEKDPDSKIFAPLAEAYRRMGLLDEATDLAERGVRKHPHFSSGRVVLGKCFFQKSEFKKAIDELKAAVSLTPENLVAHQLLAHCYEKTMRKADALSAYKMVLFFNPDDSKTAEKIKGLEIEVFSKNPLGTDKDDESDSEEFTIGSIRNLKTHAHSPPTEPDLEPEHPESVELEADSKQIPKIDSVLERELALFDSRYNRGDWDNAGAQLANLLKIYSGHPEVLARKMKMEEITRTIFDVGVSIKPLPDNSQKVKIRKLEKILGQIEMRRRP